MKTDIHPEYKASSSATSPRARPSSPARRSPATRRSSSTARPTRSSTSRSRPSRTRSTRASSASSTPPVASRSSTRATRASASNTVAPFGGTPRAVDFGRPPVRVSAPVTRVRPARAPAARNGHSPRRRERRVLRGACTPGSSPPARAPADLQLVQVGDGHVELVGVLLGQRLGDPAGGDGVRAGVVRVIERHAVDTGGGLERALALAVAVDRLVDHQRVDDAADLGDVAERLDAVPTRLASSRVRS